MFSHKFVIVLCAVGAVTAHYRNKNSSGNNKSEDLRIIDSIHNEPECLSQGGICVIAVDCESLLLTEERGLCPKQRSKGVECCYGQSVKETRCAKRGGECMERGSCRNQVLIEERATDCPKDTDCCILVN